MSVLSSQTTPIKSKCISYDKSFTIPIVPIPPPITAVINKDDYPSNSNYEILQVTIILNNFKQPNTPPYIAAPYNIKINIGNNSSYSLDIDVNNLGTFSNILNCSPSFDSKYPNGGTNLFNVFGQNYQIPNATINRVKVNNDEYLITMISCVNITNTGFAIGALVTFITPNNVTIDEGICNDKYCFCTSSCLTTRIPLINILGQSMLNGDDVSDMTFTIFDKYTYEEKKSIVDNNKNHCQLLRLECDKLKETKFIKCCPWMVSVTRGKGSTLRDKLLDLISKNLQPNNIGINQFLGNIIKYGMTRYILSRILYGNFSIDYLLEKYYKKFIKDLGRSRFCRFIEFFENCTISPDFPESFVGYEKYFLYDKKC